MEIIDGIELLKKYRDGEINHNTKIKSISSMGNVYYMHISSGADKILYENGSPVSTGYLTNELNTFEIIEEEKEIEELPLLGNPEVIYRKDSFISSLLTRNNLDHNEMVNKINELVRELNKIKKEGEK